MINFSSHFIGRCVSSRFVGKVGFARRTWNWLLQKYIHTGCNRDLNLGKDRDRDKRDVPRWKLIGRLNDTFSLIKPKLIFPIVQNEMLGRAYLPHGIFKFLPEKVGETSDLRVPFSTPSPPQEKNFISLTTVRTNRSQYHCLWTCRPVCMRLYRIQMGNTVRLFSSSLWYWGKVCPRDSFSRVVNSVSYEVHL